MESAARVGVPPAMRKRLHHKYREAAAECLGDVAGLSGGQDDIVALRHHHGGAVSFKAHRLRGCAVSTHFGGIPLILMFRVRIMRLVICARRDIRAMSRCSSRMDG